MIKKRTLIFIAAVLLASCATNDADKVSQETSKGGTQEQTESFRVLHSAFDAEQKNYKVIFSDQEGNVYFNSYYEGEEKLKKNARLQLEEKNEYDVKKYKIVSGADSGKFIVINELSLKFEGIDEEGKRIFSLKLEKD